MHVFRSIIIWDPFGKKMTQLNRKHAKRVLKVVSMACVEWGMATRNSAVPQD